MPAITGTIQDASGNGVEDVVVELVPEPASAGEAQARSGVGVLRDTVYVRTGADGTFSVSAIAGIRYRLRIPFVGWDLPFVCPAVSTRFDLLGLVPEVLEATALVTSDGTTDVRLLVKTEALETVRERFDTVRVEVAPTSSGSWTELVTFNLLAKEELYEVTEEETSGASWYRTRYERLPDVSAWSEVLQADDLASAQIITPETLREVYLFGVDLTDDAGRPFPELMFRRYIAAAVAQLSRELDAPLVAEEVVDEVHDHYSQDYSRWGNFRLDRRPIIAIRKVAFRYPSMETESEIDLSWIVVDEGGKSGVIEIVPGQGNIADVLFMQGALLPLWSGALGRVPGVWHIDYRAGYEAADVPADIKHAAAMMASIGVLNIAGDLVAGAGIANKSVSIPGLSQNVGTTSSATNSGYGSRIIEYQKELKELIPVLKRNLGKTMRMEAI